MDLSTEAEANKGHRLIFIYEYHGSVHGVNYGRLRLEAVRLIKQLLAPLATKLDFASKAVSKCPIIVLKLVPNIPPVVLNAGIGLVDVSVADGFGVSLQHLVFQGEATKLHVIIKTMVGLLTSLPDAHDPWKKYPWRYLEFGSKGLNHGSVSVVSDHIVFSLNELFAGATYERPRDYVRALARMNNS